MVSVRPYKIQIDQEILDDLWDRLRRIRGSMY